MCTSKSKSCRASFIHLSDKKYLRTKQQNEINLNFDLITARSVQQVLTISSFLVQGCFMDTGE